LNQDHVSNIEAESNAIAPTNHHHCAMNSFCPNCWTLSGSNGLCMAFSVGWHPRLFTFIRFADDFARMLFTFIRFVDDFARMLFAFIRFADDFAGG